MKKLLALLLLLALPALAQLEFIDYSTVQSPTTYTNWLLMGIPTIITNTVTIVTTNSIVGDSLPTAAAKINYDLQWLYTNGTIGGASNVILSGVVSGPSTNDVFSTSGSNYIQSMISGGGSASNAIANLNGLGTNTTLVTAATIGVTNLNATILNVLSNSYLLETNITITGISSNAIIPTMTASNAPSGFAYASSYNESYFPWQAFQGPGTSIEWASDGLTDFYPWLTYKFPSAITADACVLYLTGNDIDVPYTWTILFQSSPDGSLWTTASKLVIVASPTGIAPGNYYFTFPATTAQYWRWFWVSGINQLSGQDAEVSYAQIYTAPVNTISSSNALQIASLNGLSINTPGSGGYTLNVNGTINSASTLTAPIIIDTTNISQFIPTVVAQDISDSGNGDFQSITIKGKPINFTQLTNLIITQYFVTNCFDVATNYNGLYGFSSNATAGPLNSDAVWTNLVSGWVMIVGSTPSSVSYFLTNANNALLSIPCFTRNSGNVIGQWQYNPTESNPGYGYPYSQPQYMPYVTDITTTQPQTYTGIFNGSFNSTLPHTPASVSVGGSPWSFTNFNPTALECYLTGAAAYSVAKNGVSVYGSLAGDAYLVLQQSNYLTVTYLSAPTMTTNAW